MKYYIIAGEASGDLHASNLIKAIKRTDNMASFRCWGGDLIRQQGASVIRDYKDTAYMGFLEVILHLPAIFRNIRFCKKDITEYKPDALILVDYPGFNLRIAPFAKKNNIPVFYYISPQIWAWKSSRIKKIRTSVLRMFVILPFEKIFYKNLNMEVEFVGHPLLDAIDNNTMNLDTINDIQQFSSGKPIIALLPGSRKQEIKKILPLMLKTATHFSENKYFIAAVSSIDREFYDKIIRKSKASANITIIFDKTYPLLSKSSAALVASGTATLETALFGVPQVVCYKANYLSYLLARLFIKVKYISLVNIILNKTAVTELIQNNLSIKNLIEELNTLLNNVEKKSQMKTDYLTLKEMLGGKGASEKTAKSIVSLLKT